MKVVVVYEGSLFLLTDAVSGLFCAIFGYAQTDELLLFVNELDDVTLLEIGLNAGDAYG